MVAKLAFTSTSEDWLFLRIFKDISGCDITRVSCAIYSFRFLYYCFYLLFSEDLTVVRIKGTNLCRKCINDDISSSCGFLYDSMTWRFLLIHFSFKVSANFPYFNSGGCLLYCFFL